MNDKEIIKYIAYLLYNNHSKLFPLGVRILESLNIIIGDHEYPITCEIYESDTFLWVESDTHVHISINKCLENDKLKDVIIDFIKQNES